MFSPSFQHIHWHICYLWYLIYYGDDKARIGVWPAIWSCCSNKSPTLVIEHCSTWALWSGLQERLTPGYVTSEWCFRKLPLSYYIHTFHTQINCSSGGALNWFLKRIWLWQLHCHCCASPLATEELISMLSIKVHICFQPAHKIP